MSGSALSYSSDKNEILWQILCYNAKRLRTVYMCDTITSDSVSEKFGCLLLWTIIKKANVEVLMLKVLSSRKQK